MRVYKATAPGMKARLGNGKDHPKMGLNITTEANCAQNGWHCAENPLDCLSYFSWDGKNEFYLCEAGGDIHESGNASVVSCTELTMVKRLHAVEFVAAAIRYIIIHPSRPLHHRINESVTVTEKEFFGIACGRHPTASGEAGTVLGLVQKDEKGNITAIHIEKVGYKNVRPKTIYTIDEQGLFVKKRLQKAGKKNAT